MGTRPRARQSSSHERHHDVHVRQLAPDIQHHDGVYAVQESNHWHTLHERGVPEVRVGWDEAAAVVGQGLLCAHELRCARFGGLEGEWDGSVAYDSE